MLLAGAAVGALIGLLVAGFGPWAPPDQFRSRAAVLVMPPGLDVFAEPDDAQQAERELWGASQVALVESAVVGDPAMARLSFVAEVSAAFNPSSEITTVTAYDLDPQVAQLVAQTFGEVYVEQSEPDLLNERLEVANDLAQRIEEFDQAIATAIPDTAALLREQRNALAAELDRLQASTALSTGSGARILDPASLPVEPEPAPGLTRRLAVGAAIGAGAGGLAALVSAGLTGWPGSGQRVEGPVPQMPPPPPGSPLFR